MRPLLVERIAATGTDAVREVFETPSMRFEFRILDLKTWDGEPLLASEDWGDNVLALLTPVEQERVLQRVEEQIHKLNGEEKRQRFRKVIRQVDLIP